MHVKFIHHQIFFFFLMYWLLLRLMERKRKRETMPIRVLWTCFLYPYAFVPNMFSYYLIIPAPLSIAQMNKDKSKSSKKTTAKEENEAGELISNVSLEEHWKLRCVNSQFLTTTCTNVCGEVHYISKLIEKWNILLHSRHGHIFKA